MEIFTADNASDMVQGIDLLFGYFCEKFPDAYSDDHCFTIRCFRCFMNSAVKDSSKIILDKMKNIKSLLETIRSSINFKAFFETVRRQNSVLC